MRHLRRIIVSPARRIVVQVVKLADRGVAGLEHLGVELSRDGFDLVGGQGTHEIVHDLAPGPETVLGRAGALGQPRHGALKGVGVQVRHAGQHHATRARRG